MKQHIALDQLEELTTIQRGKLVEWFNERYSGKDCSEILSCVETRCSCSTGHYSQLEYWMNAPLLSIGQMIEFLDEDWKTDWSILFGKNIYMVGKQLKDYPTYKKSEELCDALWEAVKEVL